MTPVTTVYPIDHHVDPEFSGYLATIPETEWVDLDCGCKVQTPTHFGQWTVTTVTTGATQLSLDLGESKEKEEWTYWMSCPCGSNQLYYNDTRFTWGWMECGEEDEK